MIYILLLILSFGITYLVKEISLKKSLVAKVNERSSHTVPTPHGGGIAIAVTWFVGISYLFYEDSIESTLYYVLLLGVVISIVSYLDDIFELSPKLRVLIQSLVALVSLYLLGGFNEFTFIFFTIENQFITNIFAFFMIIWFINLYNFLDGIDGYAGSEALFLALGAFILFGDTHFLVLAVAVLGFLVWNWDKAKIFMGDVGSTLLGYNVAIFTLYYSNHESTNFWIWIILFGLFWFDATLTLYRRYKNKEKLSQAHKKHAYQRLVQSGWSHQRVTLASIALNLGVFTILYFSSSIVVVFVTSLIVLYTAIKYVDKRKGFS